MRFESSPCDRLTVQRELKKRFGQEDQYRLMEGQQISVHRESAAIALWLFPLPGSSSPSPSFHLLCAALHGLLRLKPKP